MTTDPLEKLWKSIIPLSELPKARPQTALDASSGLLPPLAPMNRDEAARRINNDLELKGIEKLTERTNDLMKEVNDAKDQVFQTSGKIARALEECLEGATALVNRSQQRILTALGRPAQEEALQQLLKSYQSIVDVVDILEKTSLIQASQTNIQSTLLVVASQGQQMSAQINSLEQMVFRRMDDFEERMSQRFEQLEKRQGEDEVQPAIKRRRLHQESATKLPDDKFVAKGTVSVANSTDSGRANATGGRRCTLPGPISLSSQDPSLTSLEEVKGQELHSEPLAGPHMAPRGSLSKRSQSTLPLKESSRSKAQKLASFFGDSETPEDGNMDDLFSRFEHA